MNPYFIFNIWRNKHRFLLLGLLLSASTVFAKSTPACATHFAQGATPQILREELSAKTVFLCFEGFAVLHSGVSRTPLWSAEHLVRTQLKEAWAIRRKDEYHPEEELPFSHRAELDDYAHSGFDRGHMTPAGDMSTDQSKYESFSLANIVPQNRENNQVLWEGIEYSTRKLALKRGELYVITGPLFEGKSLERLNGRVLVPSHLFKAIYDPGMEQAGAYIAPNSSGEHYQIISIHALEQRLGIRLFPLMDPKIKSVAMPLPKPKPYQYQRRELTTEPR